MKNISNLLILFAVLFLSGACEKDGDKFFLSTPEENELIASTEAVVLKEEAAKLYAMSLAWTEQTLQISDARYEPTTGVETSIQVSLTEDFSGATEESTESGLSKSYTVSELNIIVHRLGVTDAEPVPLYFRLAARNGSNTDAVYSNVVKVTVTPYSIDMHYADIVGAGEKPVANTQVYSANADGVYQGFVEAPLGWDNFYLEEADGTIWYTVENSPFLITTEGNWNSWFPGKPGCYFVNADTQKKQWTALLLPELSISGIENLTMTYDKKDHQWKGTFTADAEETINILINGTGKLYDNTCVSGSENTIDDTKAKDTPFAFNGPATNLTFVTGTNATGGSISVKIPKAGECTLIVDLNTVNAWKVEIIEGAEEPEPEPEEGEYIYLPGISAAGWNAPYTDKIKRYDESKKQYAGIINVDSEWGYAITTVDYWDETRLYRWSGEGDAASGKLVAENNDNDIPAPAAGLYLIEVSLSGLTYETMAVEKVSCYLGIEGDNSLVSLEATNTTGVYSGTITLDKDTDWGIKFVINNWDGSFGGYDGELYYNAQNGIKPVAAGTYEITADLIGGTYTLNNK